MTALTVRVDGTPRPQGSKRHVGHGVLIEMSKDLAPWRQAISWHTRAALNGGGTFLPAGPVWVNMQFFLARPKGHYGVGRNLGYVKASAPPYPAGRPDVDKLARAAMDGLTIGGAFTDDSQVVELLTVKRWADPATPPGVWITVSTR